MKRDDPSVELFELAGAICNDTLNQQQTIRLNELLLNNKESQRAYCQYMMLHAELFWQQDTVLGYQFGEPHCHQLPHAETSLANTLSRNSDFENSMQRSRWRRALSLAAAVLIGLTIGLAGKELFWNTESTETLDQNLASSHSPAPAASTMLDSNDHELDASAIGKPIARITGTHNCRWGFETGTGEIRREALIGYGSNLYPGQQLILKNGLAEITFENGVRVILEAPVSFDITAIGHSVLHQGRLTASVPKGAEGFQVALNGLTLVDQGTEFGVRADSPNSSEVYVFEGIVEGLIREVDGETIRKVRWVTNDAVTFDANTRTIKNVVTPTRFVRSLAPALGPHDGLLVMEDFDYPSGALGGQNGGFGWGGPWENMSVGEGRPNRVDSGSLRVAGISALGNHAMLEGQFNRVRRTLSTTFSGVFDTAGLIEDQDGARLVGRDGKEIYFSFLQKISKTDEVFYGFELNRGDGNRNRVLCIGHAAAKGWIAGPPRRPNKEAGETGWAVTSEFNGPTKQTLKELGEIGPETTDVVLVVAKISFGPRNVDVVQVFVNPESLTDEWKCRPQVVGEGNFAFDRISLANFDGEKTFHVDHIRVGTSFSSVTRQPWQSTPIASTR